MVRLVLCVLDKAVLKYASDCEELSESAETKCNLLISQINAITECPDIPHNLIKSNMRYMKFFLLTVCIGIR